MAGLSQSLPIAIDGQFDDWQNPAVFADAAGDGASLDFLECSIANDENYLFIRLKVLQEINLTDNNKIVLYIDTDHQSLTGTPYNGIGADLVIFLGERDVIYKQGNATSYFSLNDIGFFSLPTVSGKDFEIALPRFAKPDGTNPLFTDNIIRLAFKDNSGANSDALPDTGQSITYQFDDTPTAAFPAVHIGKESPGHLRLLAYNTLWNGLDDLSRTDHFKSIISALQPDIVTFNECWDITPGMAATFMNSALPLPNFQNWYAVKMDAGNITVSRFPIAGSWLVLDNSRMTASLIDLPAHYATDLLVINAHFRCCSDNNTRQREADAFIKFILDAKSPGGVITLPPQTPFVLSGDLNLVGQSQQLKTLLTGQVVNSNIYGPGGAPDWDGTDLVDIVSTLTDRRMAYTWRNQSGRYPPSRIDYHIYSNSVMEVVKSFVVETESMPGERLEQYGLQQWDTYIASDHLPKVTDFVLPMVTSTANSASLERGLKVFPNPFATELNIELPGWNEREITYLIKTPAGQTIAEGTTPQKLLTINTSKLASGMYFIIISSPGKTVCVKAVKH